MDDLTFLDSVFAPHPWGVCPFDEVRAHLLPVRSRARLPEKAGSVLAVLFPYLLENEYYENRTLSRYAVPADYHSVCGAALEGFCRELRVRFPENRFVPFVDASPLPEVLCAARAGLGAVGKNGLLIHPVYGSWVFIGTVVTDRVFPYENRETVSCIGCGRCVESCPAHALTENGLRTEDCISAITQKKKDLSDSEAALLRAANAVWGCDRCQEVCPMNRCASYTFIDAFRRTAVPVPERGRTDRAYGWRGEAVFRNAQLIQDEKL